MEKSTVKRTSCGVFEYAGSDRKVGDRFEVEQAHVPLMLSMGHIEPVEGEPGFVEITEEPHQVTAQKTSKRKAA